MARAGTMIFLSERGDDKNDGLTAEVTARVRALQKQVQEELSAWAKVVPHKTPAIALDSISVAVITLAALGRRRSSRPVGYAIGNIGFPFPGSERRENSIGGSPTGSLNPLGGGKCRGRENQSQTDYRNEFHEGSSS